jgi:predicted nucleic acid-binding protein
MSIVVDANLVAALVLPLPYSGQATQKIAQWKQDDVELTAPMLFEYEITTILRRAMVTGWVTATRAREALRHIQALQVATIAPTASLQESALSWAERLGHSKTYDAHYLALAEQQRAELWTADRRLANSVQQAGVSWVHWIGNK